MRASGKNSLDENESTSVYEGPRLQEGSKKENLKDQDFSNENIDFEPEEKKNDQMTIKEERKHSEKRKVTFSSPEGVMPILKLTGTINSSVEIPSDSDGISASTTTKEVKANIKHQLRTRNTIRNKHVLQIMKDLMLKEKLLRFIDNLRANSGRRNIKKSGLKTLKLINDLSYEHKKDWSIHEEGNTSLTGIQQVVK
jgi:hypothetical protein